MNGLIRELLANGWVDDDYVDAHTLGFDELRDDRRALHARAGGRDLRRRPPTTYAAPPDLRHVASACCPRCCRASTSPTRPPPRPCQVNNLHLLRGMIGRPGRGLLQMNGQPTAQNTRECGADGDLPGLPQLGQPRPRRSELADAVERRRRRSIPHWAPPTHAMQIFRYAEQGSIGFLWISATNPAVSHAGPGPDPRDPGQRPSCSSSSRTCS